MLSVCARATRCTALHCTTPHHITPQPTTPQHPTHAPCCSFNKVLYCDNADGLVRTASVDKVSCLQAVPADTQPGGAVGR